MFSFPPLPPAPLRGFRSRFAARPCGAASLEKPGGPTAEASLHPSIHPSTHLSNSKSHFYPAPFRRGGTEGWIHAPALPPTGPDGAASGAARHGHGTARPRPRPGTATATGTPRRASPPSWAPRAAALSSAKLNTLAFSATSHAVPKERNPGVWPPRGK